MDFARMIAAARVTQTDAHDWWIEASDTGAGDHDLPLAATLDAFAADPPRRLDRAIDDDKRPAWHWLMIANAIGASARAEVAIGTKPAFVEGSLRIAGPLKLKGSLVVTGDLVIDGPLIDVVEQWHQLVVGGNLVAHAIASSQTILVGGDCRVRDLVWAFEMHCPLAVRGTIETPLLVLADGRPVRFGAEAVATKLEDADADAMARHFDPKLLRGHALKAQAMTARLLARKPVGPTAAPAPKPKPPSKAKAAASKKSAKQPTRSR